MIIKYELIIKIPFSCGSRASRDEIGNQKQAGDWKG